MANLILEAETEQSVESRTVHVADRPIDFESFLEMAEGRWVELVDGVVVEIPMIQLDHERCSRWLYQVAGLYVQQKGLGELLSSRITVRTDAFGGRMPDMLFVRSDRAEIIQQKAVLGPPDLVIEIVSPGDRPSNLRALEADYFKLGVPELAFIDLPKQELRLLRRGSEGYDRVTLNAGTVEFDSIPGLTVVTEWLLHEPRPDGFQLLQSLLTP
jgi:Uma2 family endonuclease